MKGDVMRREKIEEGKQNIGKVGKGKKYEVKMMSRRRLQRR